MKKIFLVVLLGVLAAVMAGPAGATPPEGLEISSTSHYSLIGAYGPTGMWRSEGLIESSGELEAVLRDFGAGWPPGKGFQTAHLIEVYGDEYGSITIETQMGPLEWTYPAPGMQHFEGTGQWVILSGTEAYAELYGQGTFSVKGDADFNAYTLDVEATYSGQAHFDPEN